MSILIILYFIIVQDYHAANAQAVNSQQLSSRSVKWWPPDAGIAKAMVRNEISLVMLACAKRIPTPMSVEQAEAEALLLGINLAVEAGLKLLIVESDALGVVKLVKSRSMPCSDCLLLILLMLLIYVMLLMMLLTFLLNLVALRKPSNLLSPQNPLGAVGGSSPLKMTSRRQPPPTMILKPDLVTILLLVNGRTIIGEDITQL
ncbi:hypothetical protein ACOSQ3_006854 [Xanthoceras sorbifolium]